MSWIKENYEKAAIGGAVVVALGIGAAVLLGGGDEGGKVARDVTPSEDVSVAAAPKLNRALGLRNGTIEIAEVTAEDGRKLNIFVGQRLFAKEGSDQSVDLYSSKEDVHEGIPNEFWLKYNLDPSYANAPERDSDGDGFTELEESQAGTSPIDKKDYPPLITKLQVEDVEEFKYRMRWSEFAAPQVTIRYRDLSNNSFSGQFAPGDVLFDQDPMNKRFKLGEPKEMKDDRGNPQKVYPLVDQSPLRKGKELLLWRRGKANGENEFADYSANFKLDALGLGGNTFKLEEGESFSLPFDPKASKKPYRLKSIKPNGDGSFKLEIEVEGQGAPVERQAKGK